MRKTIKRDSILLPFHHFDSESLFTVGFFLLGRCFVVSCCQFNKVSDFPEEYPPHKGEAYNTANNLRFIHEITSSVWISRFQDNPSGRFFFPSLPLDLSPDEIITRGGSLIVSPMGEIIAGPLFNEKGILCASVDRSQLVSLDPTQETMYSSWSSIKAQKIAWIHSER